MKKQILHLAIFLLMGISASAHPFTSSLNIHTVANEMVTVVFDGVAYPDAGTDFRMENITPGSHSLKVMVTEFHGWNRRSYTRVIYNSCLITNPGEDIFATIDCFNNISISRVMNYCPPAPPACGNISYSYDNRCNTLPLQYGYLPMSPEYFYALKQSIRHCNFESSRLECAKLALANNYFTAQQVADIMNLFWFESTRLEFAKAAYPRTVDSQNYYRVNDSFSFSSSTRELNQTLRIVK